MAADVKGSETVNRETTQTDTQKNDREINFEKLRKKTEVLEQELQKRDAMLRDQQQALNQLQSHFQPKQIDEIDSLPDDELLDKAKFKRIFEKERQNLRKEAEEVARQTYAKLDNENYQQKLYSAFPDYDQIVNSSNAEKLQEKDPEFMSLLAEVKDEYKRREMAYKKMKKISQEEEKPRVKAQDIVNENKQTAGSYYSPGGQGPSSNPYAFEFDVKSPEARTKAYERLKTAQKRGF
jgi:hypothetical protein